MDKTSDEPVTPIHRIYWGLKERIWNQTGDRAHLLYAPRAQRKALAVPAVKPAYAAASYWRRLGSGARRTRVIEIQFQG